MGSLGEILLVNPLDGSLVKVLEGHRQTVCSLAFSADGQWLASRDAAGAAILWKRGQWQPTVLYEPDEKTYGAGEGGRDRQAAQAAADRLCRQGAAWCCRSSWARIRPAGSAGS